MKVIRVGGFGLPLQTKEFSFGEQIQGEQILWDDLLGH